MILWCLLQMLQFYSFHFTGCIAHCLLEYDHFHSEINDFRRVYSESSPQTINWLSTFLNAWCSEAALDDFFPSMN